MGIFRSVQLAVAVVSITLVGCVRVGPSAAPSPLPAPAATAPPIVAPAPSPAAELPARFEAASGVCDRPANCAEVRYGCGKLVCTSEPGKYRELITDCMVTPTPKDDGFACACVTPQQRCGWVP